MSHQECCRLLFVLDLFPRSFGKSEADMSGNQDWNGRRGVINRFWARLHLGFLESLCGCFDDWGSCCYGYWCLPCLFGSNSEKINDCNCVAMCCAYSISASFYLCWIPHMIERQALREKYQLRANPSCGDCPTAFCCGPCAICQEAREIKSRGLSAITFPSHNCYSFSSTRAQHR